MNQTVPFGYVLQMKATTLGVNTAGSRDPAVTWSWWFCQWPANGFSPNRFFKAHKWPKIHVESVVFLWYKCFNFKDATNCVGSSRKTTSGWMDFDFTTYGIPSTPSQPSCCRWGKTAQPWHVWPWHHVQTILPWSWPIAWSAGAFHRSRGWKNVIFGWIIQQGIVPHDPGISWILWRMTELESFFRCVFCKPFNLTVEFNDVPFPKIMMRITFSSYRMHFATHFQTRFWGRSAHQPWYWLWSTSL